MSGKGFTFTEYFLTKNDCYKAGRTIAPKGIMVHSTGAWNTFLRRYIGPDDGLLGPNRYNNHWNMSNAESLERFGKRLNKCVHAFIGRLDDRSIAVYQALPWNHRGWHCASGPKGSGNNTHISFEICEDDRTGAEYFAEVYEKAVALCAMLCKMYDFNPLTPGVLIDHAEGRRLGIASNHADVGHWFPRHGKSMGTFRRDVATKIAISIAEEVDKLDRLIVAHSEGDRFAKEELEKALKCGSILRSFAGIYKDVKIKELYVVGGPLEVEGIAADKVVHLSGLTRWDTFQEVGKFLGHL